MENNNIKECKQKYINIINEKNKEIADYTMLYELLGSITEITEENNVINKIVELFDMLFGIEKLVYIRVENDEFIETIPKDTEVDIKIIKEFISNSNKEYIDVNPGNGFILKVSRENEVIGVLKAEEFMFPEHKEKYLKLAFIIKDVCALAIANARKYRKIKEAEEKLFIEKENLSTTLRSIADGVIAVDNEGSVSIMNFMAQKLTGWVEKEAQGKYLEDVFIMIDDKTGNKKQLNIKEYIKNERRKKEFTDVILISKDGIRKDILCSLAPINYGDDKMTDGAIFAFKDITEQKKAENELQYLSFHDTLTNLYNRNYFEQKIKELDNEKNLPLGLIVCDIDGLKYVNDTMGHKKGDSLIKSAADVLTACFRDEVARIGGDEFSIIMISTTKNIVKKASERIKELVENFNKNDNEIGFPLSISVGYALKNNKTQKIMTIFKEADDIMYKDKKENKKKIGELLGNKDERMNFSSN